MTASTAPPPPSRRAARKPSTARSRPPRSSSTNTPTRRATPQRRSPGSRRKYAKPPPIHWSRRSKRGRSARWRLCSAWVSLRGTFVVAPSRPSRGGSPRHGAAMIAPLLRLAATTAAGRALRDAAADATNRLMLILGAAVGGAVALFCLSRAAVTLLERHMDPAEAWDVLGGFYGGIRGALQLAATRRRRGCRGLPPPPARGCRLSEGAHGSA